MSVFKRRLVTIEKGSLCTAEKQKQRKGDPAPQWVVCALDKDSGNKLWEKPLPSEPLYSSLLIDRDGRVIVVLKNGRMICYGAKR